MVGLYTSDRGPRSFWSFYSRTLGLSVSRGPRSEVLLGALYDVGAFRLSPTSALWSLGPFVVGLCTSDRGPRSFLVFLLSDSRSLGLSRSEVRGPFRSSLRRRRFPAFSDVRALVSRSFCGRTLYIWQRSAVFLVFLLSDSRSLGLSRSEVRGPFRGSLRRRSAFRLSQTSALFVSVLSHTDSAYIDRSPSLPVSHFTNSVLRGPRSADSSSVLQIGWLRIFFV